MFDMLNVRERMMLDEMRRADPQAPRNRARLEAAKGWRAEFFRNDNPLFQRMYSGRRAIGTAPTARGVPHHADVAVVRQLRLLISRYWRIKIRDRMGSAIMFLQAPIIGVLLWLVFGGQKPAVPFWCLGALQELSTKNNMDQSATTNLLNTMQPTTDHTAAMFFVVVSCVWFGTSNAAREIVTERAIYLRERMVNLRLINYLLSKYILLSFFCVAQCTMLLAIVFFALGFNGGPMAFLLELANLIALAMNATALGLLVSALVASAEAAMALTPIALIPQVVLGGLMVPMTTNANLKPLMYLDAFAVGVRGRDRERTNGDRGCVGVEHRPAQTRSHEPAGLRSGRRVQVRRRSGREQLSRRRVGIHRVGHAMDAGCGALRNDLRHVRHPARRAKTARSGLATERGSRSRAEENQCTATVT